MIITKEYLDNLGEIIQGVTERLPLFAGGCIYDTLHGQEPKDIDTYIASNNQKDFFKIADKVKQVLTFVENKSIDEAYTINNRIVGVVNFETAEGYPVQLIGFAYNPNEQRYNLRRDTYTSVPFPSQVMETFDFNLCKAWYAPFSKDFISDPDRVVGLEHRQLIYRKHIDTDTDMKFFLKRLPRLQNKFPDYNFMYEPYGVFAIPAAVEE